MATETALPNPWMLLPFGVLLAAIALGPVVIASWWHRHYAKVAYSLGAVTLAYYLVGLRAYPRVLQVGHEYVSFIALIGALYVVAGGIHIRVKAEGTPRTNALFLLFGAVIANLLGTTGASMLLIRPWLRMNASRLRAHHVVFFIFIVSNVGGCLTPIGDPPLFLGYLKGVPFWWVAEHCWPMWAVGVGLLLAVFYVLDRRGYHAAPRGLQAALADTPSGTTVEGSRNLVFLVVLLGAVFVNKPLFLREGLLVAVALGSWFTTPRSIHQANQFDFHPIREVAILFVGLFATMMPALDWLEMNAGTLGTPGVGFVYWACGTLSSLLDNAPTYLSFLSATLGSFAHPDAVGQLQHLVQTGGADLASVAGPHAEQIRQAFAVIQKYHAAALSARTLSVEQIEVALLLGNPAWSRYLLAISVAAVFFGANTYIGNGPNFMVKAIADRQRVPTPGFLGFLFKFTVPYMLPVLLIVWWLFFRT